MDNQEKKSKSSSSHDRLVQTVLPPYLYKKLMEHIDAINKSSDKKISSSKMVAQIIEEKLILKKI